ncbi:hypothetical protein MFLAVUS_007289 [Mucor flavus]|uniref:Guanine nucleotide-binding protein-like 3 N-terminal domain-containing protein n=1 Tax=Mucor flavus TaxID=439312 RepID=A0ABP9Z3W5_9FUNG
MVPKKIQSKRVRTAHKHRILKRIVDHHRKERRSAKKNPGKFNKPKKDPGIPNAWPFKEELLNELEALKNQDENEKQRMRLANQVERAKAKKVAKKEEIAANIAASTAAAKVAKHAKEAKVTAKEAKSTAKAAKSTKSSKK